MDSFIKGRTNLRVEYNEGQSVSVCSVYFATTSLFPSAASLQSLYTLFHFTGTTRVEFVPVMMSLKGLRLCEDLLQGVHMDKVKGCDEYCAKHKSLPHSTLYYSTLQHDDDDCFYYYE